MSVGSFFVEEAMDAVERSGHGYAGGVLVPEGQELAVEGDALVTPHVHGHGGGRTKSKAAVNGHEGVTPVEESHGAISVGICAMNKKVRV